MNMIRPFLSAALGAALLSPLASASAPAVVPPPPECLNLNLFWNESGGKVLLIKAEPFVKTAPPVGDVGYLNSHPFTRGTSDGPATLVIGKVVLSTSADYKPGTLVLLEVPGAVTSADGVWWIAAARKDTLPLTEDGSAIFICGLDFNCCAGEKILRHREKLSGFWKEMADLVAGS